MEIYCQGNVPHMFKKLLPSSCLLFVSSNLYAQGHNFQAMLECHTSSNKPGIAVRIEQAGKLIYTGAWGVADIKTLEPLHDSQVFQIGSITKQFTAAAILQLSEQRKLSLSDTLGDFISDINPDYATLSLDRILSHTSGLPNYNSDPEIGTRWHEYAQLNEVVESISQQAIQSSFGSEYRYSNTGYVLLGKVIEVASGMSYSDYMSRNIFKPLNMKDTYVITRGDSSGVVKGYSGRTREQDSVPEKVDRSWIHAAGAIASTLEDMSRWHHGLKAGKIVSKNNYEQMVTRAKLTTGEQVNYGFGFDIYPISQQASYSHQGAVPGFMSWSVYFPESDLFATAFSNKDTLHPGPALLDMIAAQIGLSPRLINDDSDETHAKNYLGTYRADDGNELLITMEQQSLFSQSEGGEKRKLRLRENNAFSYECTENHFQLRQSTNKTELVPIDIYHGEGPSYIKVAR